MHRRPTRALLASAVVLLSAGLASCAHEAAPIADRPPAPSSVSRAVRALVARQNVDFTSQLTLGGTTVTDDGAFVLHPAAEEFTHRSDDGQGSVSAVDVIGADGHYYVRAPAVTSSAQAGCYVDSEARDLDILTGGVYDQHLTFLPGAAVIAASARGSTYVDDHTEDVNGTVDLADVLRLALADLPAQLGVRAARLPAELHIEGGVLVGISVALHDFVAANAIDRGKLASLGQARLEITFTFPSDPEPIEAPSTDQVSQFSHGAVAPCASAGASGAESPSSSPTSTSSPTTSPDSSDTGGGEQP